jgi:hypothetical protein
MAIYRENQEIEIVSEWGKNGCETKKVIINTQANGRYNGYLNYFKCAICKNQCVGDDKPFYCNNSKFEVNEDDTKMYCLNFKKDFDIVKVGRKYIKATHTK